MSKTSRQELNRQRWESFRGRENNLSAPVAEVVAAPVAAPGEVSILDGRTWHKALAETQKVMSSNDPNFSKAVDVMYRRLGGGYGVTSAVAAVDVGPRGGTTKVQSLLFSKALWTKQTAKQWARAHGFKAVKTDSKPTSEYIRVRQRMPKKSLQYRIKEFGNGIKAVMEIEKGMELSPASAVGTEIPEVVVQCVSHPDVGRYTGITGGRVVGSKELDDFIVKSFFQAAAEIVEAGGNPTKQAISIRIADYLDRGEFTNPVTGEKESIQLSPATIARILQGNYAKLLHNPRMSELDLQRNQDLIKSLREADEAQRELRSDEMARWWRLWNMFHRGAGSAEVIMELTDQRKSADELRASFDILKGEGAKDISFPPDMDKETILMEIRRALERKPPMKPERRGGIPAQRKSRAQYEAEAESRESQEMAEEREASEQFLRDLER